MSRTCPLLKLPQALELRSPLGSPSIGLCLSPLHSVLSTSADRQPIHSLGKSSSHIRPPFTQRQALSSTCILDRQSNNGSCGCQIPDLMSPVADPPRHPYDSNCLSFIGYSTISRGVRIAFDKPPKDFKKKSLALALAKHATEQLS
jgi:hypothetical protein